MEEETGIKTYKEKLKFLEINEHDLVYNNGDKTHYSSYVYKFVLNNYPSIKLNKESDGIMLISKNNYKEFTFLNDNTVFQMHKYWWNLIERELED